MLYLSPEDFFQKAAACTRLSREAEIDHAQRMRDGDALARRDLIHSYLPMVAGHIRRLPRQYQALSLIYTCVQTLENALDRFDFSQNGETFAHRLSWHLRQCTTRHIATTRYNISTDNRRN